MCGANIIERDSRIINKVNTTSLVANIAASKSFVLVYTRFSSQNKLLNTFAIVFRSVSMAKGKTSLPGPPDNEENQHSPMSAAADVNTNISMSKISSINPLVPFIDHKGVSRVSSRICTRAEPNINQKLRSILYPCRFVLLIAQNLHQQQHHPGASAKKNLLSAEKTASSHRRSCFRAEYIETQQPMAKLLGVRVNKSSNIKSSALNIADSHIDKSPSPEMSRR